MFGGRHDDDAIDDAASQQLARQGTAIESSPQTRGNLLAALLRSPAAVGVACLVGIPLGMLAGLRGGWTDFAVMRLIEVMTAFPGLLFAIFLMTVLGFVLYPYVYMTARAMFMTQPAHLMEAARTLGASPLLAFFNLVVPGLTGGDLIRGVIVAHESRVVMDVTLEAGLARLFGGEGRQLLAGLDTGTSFTQCAGTGR